MEAAGIFKERVRDINKEIDEKHCGQLDNDLKTVGDEFFEELKKYALFQQTTF